ncbi:MAG: SDR family oxidoreductase [Sphingomonadales bacterium]|nr:SDR family oxidoreductase [Sphingomonadales bacterium]
MNLAGQVVWVIGGTSGIGLGVARAALAAGAKVAVASRSATKVAKACQALPGVAGIVLDVTDEDAVRRQFAGQSGIDHIVFTAADWDQVHHTPLASTDIRAAASIFDVRVWGAVAVAKHSAPALRPGGSITLTNGMAAHRPQAGMAVTVAMAGAIEHLVKGLAVELAPVRVNGVCPGAIRTEAWDELPDAFRAVQEARLAGQLVPRVGETAECAEAYLYLMKNTYVTGQTLRVEGGWSLKG